jgi:hypothetical protein
MNPFEVKPINDDEKEIISLGSRVEQLEKRMIEYKKLEENYKQAKEELRQKMLAKDIKTWTLTNGTKLTAIADVEPKEKKTKAFAVAKLKDEMPEVYEKYVFEHTEMTSGRKGSLRVTLPKEA